VTPIEDVQQLYKQWQEGKLLNSDERKALAVAKPDGVPQTFAALLKTASDQEPTS